MQIKLPSLYSYKNEFIGKGVSFPLHEIPFVKTGLLAQLPLLTKEKTGWPWTEETNPEIYGNSSQNWPKLTIVTPSYNQAQFIEETIRSVLLQNYPNLEYIIMDGGSTDGSVDIIKKYAPWVSYWQSDKDRGQGHAINQGFSLASGEYYAWLNSDDHYLNETFFKVISRFRATRASFVYGYALNLVTETQQFNRPTNVIPVWDYFIRMPSLPQPSCFWNAEIHQPIWEDLHCALDFELWLRILKGRKRSLIKEPLSVAKIHIDAKTSDPKMKERWEADHLLICSADAHGPIHNWKRVALLNYIRVKLHDWLRLK